MTTRATILKRAFGRIGIADYEFDIDPDERADARLTLDAMMAEWAQVGVDLGYTASEGADNDGTAMTTPAYADAPIWNNLAIRLAPDYGKQVLTDLRRDAKRGYDLVVGQTMLVPTESRPYKRLYGGADRYYRRFSY